MKNNAPAFLALALTTALLTGCAGKPVTVPATEAPAQTAATEAPATAPVKTGLYIGADLSKSQSAADGEAGKAKMDVTMVAVTVTEEGVIASCAIDTVPATVEFDAEGGIATDLTAEVLTKNELGGDYGMKESGSAYEWNEQAAALARYAEGKTVEELKTAAIDESGHALDADLASSASIYLGGFVAGIEQAVNNARHLGAKMGARLTLASRNTLDGSKNAGDEDGVAQLDSQIAAVTWNGDVISSCYIDGIQPKVRFDAKGVITSDLTAEVLTKNQLGEDYGMVTYGGAQFEWNEQAASFAAYVTGKTAAEVSGIAVTEAGKAEDADLSSGVTISIGSFLELIQKAAN